MDLFLSKLYYKYFDSSVNHYRLLLLTEEYQRIGKNYFYKYPNAERWKHLNKELFELNKSAEMEYMELSEKQAEIKREFFKNLEIICKDKKDCIVCSEHFQDYYVNRQYHYGQSPEIVIRDITTDIRNMKTTSW